MHSNKNLLYLQQIQQVLYLQQVLDACFLLYSLRLVPMQSPHVVVVEARVLTLQSSTSLSVAKSAVRLMTLAKWQRGWHKINRLCYSRSPLLRHFRPIKPIARRLVTFIRIA